MDALLKFLDINTVFFSVFGYPMSYLEFTGTCLNLLSVWLVTRNNIWTWPIGNVAVVLFGVLFYQIQLYSDFIEQIYFLITGMYGWWIWARHSASDSETSVISITHNSKQGNYITVSIVVIGTMIMGLLMEHVHLLLPSFFTVPASYPYLDAFTTVMSFTAILLMAHKKIECWILWILVDIIGIGLYGAKEVFFVALLYGIFLVLATKGFISWIRIMKEETCS